MGGGIGKSVRNEMIHISISFQHPQKQVKKSQKQQTINKHQLKAVSEV